MALDSPTLTAASPLTAWAQQQHKVRPQRFVAVEDGLRFAFYGRISTADHQDRASSHYWQITAARDLIDGRGRIAAEFFDVGVSRRVAWSDRPQARLLLSAITTDSCDFDAIVVGEYERAFQGQQLDQVAAVIRRHGIALWLPETYGPVDFDSPRQLALLDLLGVRSQREVSRARHRVIAAMRAQTELQGRHLGGRPPYGYQLVDAGPHPNRADAAWGRRLHRLEPDPVSAAHVRWIFEQRLRGRSVARIARELNEREVPCPSRSDPGRNTHRTGSSWMLTTVAAILANPRYTGRQVWNRQPSEHLALDSFDGMDRHADVQRRTDGAAWVVSAKPSHPALVSEQDFVAVQRIHTAPTPADGSIRSYALTGLIYCNICGRAMDAHWSHGRPGYRCRHGHSSAHAARPSQPAVLYCREDHIIELVQHDKALLIRHPMLRGGTTPAVASYLRSHSMILVGDHEGWAVESEDCRVPLATRPLIAALKAKVPTQRGRD